MTSPKTILLRSSLRLLRPLARIMLRHGLSTYEFSKIANIAFIQAAQDILHEQGKSSSFSRVSTITGLHRHVVSEIARSAEANQGELAADKDYQRNRLARVLSGWFEDPKYTDSDGRPLVLPADGPAPSFAELVRTFSGDIYPKIILDELLRVGAVRALKDGSLRAVARRYTLGGADPAALKHLGIAARDLLCTLEHNIAAPGDSRLFDDSVVSVRLDSSSIPLLRHLVRRRAASFLEDVEGWLSEHEASQEAGSVRTGVMVQMFIDPESQLPDEPPKRHDR